MNWTAWNSVRAKALANSPSAIPRTRSRWRGGRPRARCGRTRARAARTTAPRPASPGRLRPARRRPRSRPAGRRAPAVSSAAARAFPEVRSRSIVIEVTMNIATKGKAEQRHAEGLEDGLPIAEELVDEHLRDARHREQERDRAGRGAAAGGPAARWPPCDGGSRAALRPVDQGEECRVGVLVPVGERSPSRRPRREDPPVPRMSTGESQRSPPSITWLETKDRRALPARRSNDPQRPRLRTGSSPTVGSSRTNSSGG